MNRVILFFLVVWPCLLGAQPDSGVPGYRRDYKAVESFSRVQDRNLYLLTLLQQLPEVNALLAGDETLAAVRARVLQRVEQSLKSCEKDRSCIVNAFMWRAEDIQEIRDRLAVLTKKEKALKTLVRDHVRPSGYFQNFAARSDEELVATAWADAAAGMNRILEVYGNGKAPRYARIDSVTYDIRSKPYIEAVYLWGQEVYRMAESSKPFFAAPLQFALTLLDINNRDEAARYEPMERLQNREAVDALPKIKWEKYPYSAIVILGAVSPIYASKLPPQGKLNVKLGADNFTSGLAPLIIVSGGHVHPFRTPNCEALEMKRELMEKYHIPESCIIIEPHARHTTTNLRNASRLIYKYGIPVDKKCLITTNSYHSTYVESEQFPKRCMEELGFQPGQILKRISGSTLEFLPDVKSLHRSADDPLDP
jgi:hypothetical protein